MGFLFEVHDKTKEPPAATEAGVAERTQESWLLGTGGITGGVEDAAGLGGVFVGGGMVPVSAGGAGMCGAVLVCGGTVVGATLVVGKMTGGVGVYAVVAGAVF